MPADFLPARDAALALWTANFATLTTATPTAYGLTAPQAADFSDVNDTWQAALATATNPATRTKPSVNAKDAARQAVRDSARQLGQIAQSFPDITGEQLADLGLTVRKTTRTTIPPPSTFPLVDILATGSHALKIGIHDQNTPNKRARPFGVIGAQVYVSFGPAAPTAIAGMTFIGLQTRFPINWDVGAENTGKTCWVIARWQNAKGDTGPISGAVSSVVA
jgi:hypothetical protein